MGRKVIQNETLKMKEAFEYYYALGDERNLSKVAEHFRVTETTAYNWSSSFDWQERIQQRDIEVATEMQRKTIKEIANTKANYRKIISVGIKKFAEKLLSDDGGIDLTKIQDLERLMKLDLLLMGEVVDRKEVNGTQKVAGAIVTTEDREAALALARAMIADVESCADDNDEGEDTI